MAASPIALFPFMRTLATVNLYCHFGTYYRADGAAGTCAAIVKRNW
jgi:hypothetical protein